MFTRSELHERQLDAFPSRTANSSTSSSSPSFISSLPTTPRRPSHTLPSQAHNSPSSVGLLTPSSSKASLSPALSRYKGQYQPPSPAFSLDEHRKSKRAPPNRRLFFPVRASLELHTHPARSSAAYMSDEASRPGSPVRRSRAMSRARPELGARPPSRCESLLRDTLRRADEQERTMSHRNASRSPGRWAGRKTRHRGNSLFEALNREGSADSDFEFEDNVFVQPTNEGDAFSYLNRAQPMAMRGRCATSASSTEAGSLPYGSPSSPSPMPPPSMLRTRTSPTVPRVRGRIYDDEAPRLPPSPRTEQRRSLPHTVSQSHASIAASNDSSPKQRLNTLSPHESVLRAKLEYVLQKAGPPCVDESAVSSQLVGRVRRNHQCAFSHGVTVITSPKHRDDPFSTSPSPQSLAPSSLSNSVTDLARVHSRTSQRRDSFACRTSSSSPPEPITPPPTPPFNARTASEVCKRMDGYVSFASVEGLGEPPGIDIDGEDSEEGLRRWGRFFRMFPFVSGVRGSSEHEAGQQRVVSRYRPDSATSMN